MSSKSQGDSHNLWEVKVGTPSLRDFSRILKIYDAHLQLPEWHTHQARSICKSTTQALQRNVQFQAQKATQNKAELTSPMKENLNFSNSLIIHDEKTKEIITVKEVWICDPN